jgi:hypothetical protein
MRGEKALHLEEILQEAREAGIVCVLLAQLEKQRVEGAANQLLRLVRAHGLQPLLALDLVARSEKVVEEDRDTHLHEDPVDHDLHPHPTTNHVSLEARR